MRKFISIFFSVSVMLLLLGYGALFISGYFTYSGAPAEGYEDISYGSVNLIIGLALLILSIFPLISIFIKRSVFSRRRPILAVLAFIHDAYFTGLLIDMAFAETVSAIQIGKALLAVIGLISIINVLSTMVKD